MQLEDITDRLSDENIKLFHMLNSNKRVEMTRKICKSYKETNIIPAPIIFFPKFVLILDVDLLFWADLV